jgi:putative ABC transport system ATP-binding protein/lipoprotein-releasing system ATP-binding protein
MIKLENVSKIYQISREHTVQALHPLDLEIQAGEFVVILGRSGSGKTTLLNLLAGLTRPTSGRVWLDDVDLWSIPDKQQTALRNQKIGFIFQFPSLLPSLNTLENVALPSIFRQNGAYAAIDQRARQLLETVGLSDKLAVYPRQLSAGQQQRIVICRALLNNPQILLADEPTSDLDEQTEIEIMELFSQIHHQTGITVLMVTHSSQLVKYGTRAIQMAQGKIIDQTGE